MAASAHSLLLSLFIALSLSSIQPSSAARHLLQAQPAIPSLPKVALPPLPAMPTLPKAALPPLPTTPLPTLPTAAPTFPKPTLPPLPSTAPIPTIPTLPKVTLPPLPAVTSFPTIPTTIPAIPFFSPPPSTTSP